MQDGTARVGSHKSPVSYGTNHAHGESFSIGLPLFRTSKGSSGSFLHFQSDLNPERTLWDLSKRLFIRLIVDSKFGCVFRGGSKQVEVSCGLGLSVSGKNSTTGYLKFLFIRLN